MKKTQVWKPTKEELQKEIEKSDAQDKDWTPYIDLSETTHKKAYFNDYDLDIDEKRFLTSKKNKSLADSQYEGYDTNEFDSHEAYLYHKTIEEDWR